MKIVSFTPAADPHPHDPRLGLLLDGDHVLDLTHEAARIPQPKAYLDWFDLDGGPMHEVQILGNAVANDAARLEGLIAAGAVTPKSDVRLLAPVPRPGKLICIGLNYKDHAEESGMDIPERPLAFSKFASCVVGPEDEVVLPPGATEVDYEAELAFVVGRRAHRVSADKALDHVLGYACLNDVSARDFQFADGQWQRGKSCDTFAPLGPFIATTDEIPAPETLRISLRLNGETLQDSNTDQLIFGIAALVSELSHFTTLEPGDVVCTGTPPGVGFARKPPVYLKGGDTMEVDIAGLGVLKNPVVVR